MDFVSAVLILVVYYIRPQDWLPGLAGFNLMQPVALFAVLALVARRGLPDIREIISSPLDVLMLIYGGYIVITGPELVDTMLQVLPIMIFYFVTRMAIDTPERLHRYLNWWVGMLLVIAAFGVGSLFGIDVTGAKEMTEIFKGRLALGTWIHNNPNSLGHTVILAIPAVYFTLFWRSSFSRRIAAVALMLLAGYCVYKTASRGSFIAGLAVVTFGMALGRPKFVQVLIGVFVVTSATALLSVLPRMKEVSNLSADEGVQGRMMVWEIARTTTKTHTYGDGWKEFEAYIEYEGEVFPKATHSNYIRVAADLGIPGLFLYLGILWCAARSLFSLKSVGASDPVAERSRRILFVFLIGYMISGWMIDRSYQTEYFLLAAAVAAMYKMFRLDGIEEVAAEEVSEVEFTVGFTQDMRPRTVEQVPEESSRPPWRRFGIFDALVCIAFLQLTLAMWDYIMNYL